MNAATEVLSRLAELLRKPPPHQNWGVMKAREFKAAAQRANKLVQGKSTRMDWLEPALKQLESFY